MHSLPVSLTDDQIEDFGRELDLIQREARASLGARDRAYIQRVIAVQRGLALGGRIAIYAGALGAFPLLALGTLSLGLAKIIENMEIGHNVIHGQWDWMNDPEIHSSTWEWDNVCPAEQWKHSHNVVHHTWTNVIGKDRDVGYEILRISDRQPWRPFHLAQPVYNAALAMMFQWGVGMHDLDGKDTLAKLRGIGRKAGRQLAKDYVVWPLLAGPGFLPVLLANLVANLMRNLWTYAIIFCGHFPDGAQLFTEEQIRGETRGRWYLRQILGSCNITGGRLFHVMSGNLSFQIEHHLFPDLPSNRYAEVAPKVEALCARFGIPYNKGSFRKQLGSTMRTILRLAVPTRALAA